MCKMFILLSYIRTFNQVQYANVLIQIFIKCSCVSFVLTEGQNLACLFSPNFAVLIYPFQIFQSAKHKELLSKEQSVVAAGSCNSDCMAVVFMYANFSRFSLWKKTKPVNWEENEKWATCMKMS